MYRVGESCLVGYCWSPGEQAVGQARQEYKNNDTNEVHMIPIMMLYLWWSLEGVGIKDRLYHDQGIRDIFTIQYMSVEGIKQEAH